MTKRSSVLLGEALQEMRPGFASGSDSDDGLIQFRMHNLSRDCSIDWKRLRRIDKTADEVRDLLLKPGDILFNSTNSPDLVGKSAVFPGFSEPVTYSNHYLRLRTKRDLLEPKYLAFWLAMLFGQGRFQSMSRQWVNQASVNQDQFLALEVPLLPLLEQRRIAAILDQADTLRIKRKSSLPVAELLSRSLFLGYFGDPITNPMNWPVAPIKDIGTVVTGNTPSRENPKYYGTEIEWVKSDNLNTPHYYVTQSREKLSKLGRSVARIAPEASILVTCIAGSKSCIGNAAVADREVAFNQQINALIPKDGNTHYLFAQLGAAKPLIQAASTGGMKGMVSKSRFEAILLPVPPMPLQLEFSKAMLKLLEQQHRYQVSLVQFESLFASLQHTAFHGEL